MEDQQPESAHLTEELSDADGANAETDGAEDEIDRIEDTEHPADDGHPVGGWLSRIGGWPGIAAAVAAAMFIGSVVYAGASVQPHLADRADAANRLDIARTAADAVTTLWTYTPDTIDTLADRTGHYLTGDFATQYRRFLESVVLPNKRARVTNDTTVVGVAVESLNDTDGVAMVFTNTTATSPLTQNVPSRKYVAYRLEMKHESSRWRVNSMATVSFIDLTPQL